MELMRRELASRCLYDFAHYVYRGYPYARHLKLLCERLDEVVRYVETGGAEGTGRLMVFMPPRYWKSSTTSVCLPPFFLGRLPDKRIILTSYGGSLAMGFSRRARNLLATDSYRAVFGDRSAKEPVMLSEDSRSVETWDLDKRAGGLAAAGVGGAITGKGADLFLIDDPHKNRSEAESEAKRTEIWNWWSADAQSRLEQGAAVVLIMTRWHPDDLAGKLLKAMITDPDADQWEVLCLPAIAEAWARPPQEENFCNEKGEILEEDYHRAQQEWEQEFRDEFVRALKDGWWRGVDPLEREAGEPLWPEKFPLEALARRKANTIGYDWVALYAQRPRRVEGNIIKPAQFQVIDADQVPAEVRPVRYWDLSVGRSERAHPLASALCGRDNQKRFYILDVREFRPPWSSARKKIVRVMLEDPPEVKQGIEVAGQQDGYYQDFRDDDQLQKRSIVAVNPKQGGDKIARAQLWATRAEDGLIYMVRGPWNENFESQCVNFPAEPNDMVDGVSGCWQMLPGFVDWDDLPQGVAVPTAFDPFGERISETGRDVVRRNPDYEGVSWRV